MKQYYFLVGLPRAGNTLLSSLINQNPNVCMTANSILIYMLWHLEFVRTDREYANFPDKKSFNNVTHNLFDTYYSDYKANKIIDRGSWGDEFSLKQIKENVTDKPKFIIMYRPVVECLASFVKVGSRFKGQELLDFYLPEGGMITKSMNAIKNLMANNEDYLFLQYNDLVSNPIDTVKKVFEFIDEEYIPIRVTNLDQIKINNTVYDDSVLDSPLHKIKTDVIKSNDIDVEQWLDNNQIETALAYDNIIKELANVH
tara:strand:+ start:1646 stop:2413 length:768 start_codon:yes stop_codon:yes gene_type:complete